MKSMGIWATDGFTVPVYAPYMPVLGETDQQDFGDVGVQQTTGWHFLWIFASLCPMVKFVLLWACYYHAFALEVVSRHLPQPGVCKNL